MGYEFYINELLYTYSPKNEVSYVGVWKPLNTYKKSRGRFNLIVHKENGIEI